MSKWLWGAVILAIVLVAGCVGQTTCESPNVLIDSRCCLDENSNGVCDSDEAPPALKEPEATFYCGDGTCSSKEACKYDSGSDKYVSSCPDDCGTCPAFVYLTSSYLEPMEDYSYVCVGYKEGVCSEVGDNKFKIENRVGPYEAEERGVQTTVKNVGEGEAATVQSSFKCYSNDTLVLESDKDSYKGVAARDYFWDYKIKREVIDTLYPQAEGTYWHLYYLQLDIHDIEESFDLTCDVTVSSEEPSWSNTQTVEISFVK
ncbi:MAG: hypothetical protein ACE5J7_04540 [Candidatus Aenigmatarchaeota archaeon]